MIYYNTEGKKIEFKKDINKFIDNGCCANVYRYDSENAIKIYNDKCFESFRLSKDIFDEIKSIKSDNLVKISDILFKENVKNDFKNYLFKMVYGENALLNKYKVVGYLMKYYEQAKLNILETDIDYMLQNMYQLEKLFDIFTKKGIFIDDVKWSNVILGENNIVLIDPDLFQKVAQPYYVLKSINNQQLLRLFKSLFNSHYELSQTQIPEFLEINDKLFKMSMSDSLDATKKISKRLHKVRYPIDYFYRRDSKKKK